MGMHIQTTTPNWDAYPLGDTTTQGKSNEDNIAHLKYYSIIDTGATLRVISPKWMGNYGAKKDENSYLILENLMVSKDNFLPYIDSDELKAEGGAISKALIVALVLSEERRAA